MWSSRPSALQMPLEQYATASVGRLVGLYQQDNHGAVSAAAAPTSATGENDDDGYGANGDVRQTMHNHLPLLPAAPRSTSRAGDVCLRTCQWNVHCCNDSRDDAEAMADALLETRSDVMVLNEVGLSDMDPTLRRRLELAGYHVTVCSGRPCWPTAVAARTDLLVPESSARGICVGDSGSPTSDDARDDGAYSVGAFWLDSDRGAVRADVLVPATIAAADDDTNGDHLRSSSSVRVRVYGTHLEASDDRFESRHEEMRELLHALRERQQLEGLRGGSGGSGGCSVGSSPAQPAAILIAGDFNQQREQDYTATEWTKIAANKGRRGSPLDDGVADLLRREGFVCVWDHCFRRRASLGTEEETVTASAEGIVSPLTCNWKHSKHDPPPSTHWTGTIIDYTYYRNESRGNNLGFQRGGGSGKLLPCGVFVSPSGLSDHRLIVYDWKWKRCGDYGGGDHDLGSGS